MFGLIGKRKICVKKLRWKLINKKCRISKEMFFSETKVLSSHSGGKGRRVGVFRGNYRSSSPYG